MIDRPDSEVYLGLFGPYIRAEVGDTIVVVFRNNCSNPHSITPHNLFYDKNDEGKAYNDGTSGYLRDDESVLPGGTYTHVWDVPIRAGPSFLESGCIATVYHSATNAFKNIQSGLVGPLVVCKSGTLVTLDFRQTST